MKSKFTFLAIIIITLGCTSEPIRRGTETSNLPTLEISELANKINFHEQKIELTGYYFSEFEMSGLFERKRSDTNEAVWVNFSDELHEQITDEQFLKLKGRKLRIQGTYNAKSRGHLMQYIGTVELDFLETLN
ncbi:hypothetical protein BFP72_03195 [Reichenbachiella sp. 5M10]|uniref:hypothetical protein n=1 Tax=Reichenbachiella sp. 5M10 TaxID=1889772 RepID=UPI000C148A38|nr:hypothetical protein [Reichenbachiella sp. 5M10]PIB34487.1 hypothetical protein BFP72_03195 [Reichenbachiella sp. 5M10]